MAKKKGKAVIGALLHEYKNVIDDLKKNISGINDSDLVFIADEKTANKDCISV